jgi:hypothetical protein
MVFILSLQEMEGKKKTHPKIIGEVENRPQCNQWFRTQMGSRPSGLTISWI